MFPIAMVAFRDGLEATLFIGILAAAIRAIEGRKFILSTGILLGLFGATLLAIAAESIDRSTIGTDFVQLCIVTAIFAMLFWHIVWASQHAREMIVAAQDIGSKVKVGSMSNFAVMFSIAMIIWREGSEIILFTMGTDISLANSGIAALLGVCASALIGGLIYKGFVMIKPAKMFTITNIFVVFVAAGIAGRMAEHMAALHWIPTGADPFWDMSRIISSDGVVGTILRGIMDYEAKPSEVKLVGFAIGLVVMAIPLIKGLISTRRHSYKLSSFKKSNQ